jgi:O-antigen ligase
MIDPPPVRLPEVTTKVATGGESGLRVLLAATIVLPAIVYRVATYHGDVVAILYREPKKDAVGVLGWALVLGFLLLLGRRLDRGKLWEIITDPGVIALSLLLSYLGLTRLWVTVPENWAYEMSQYALLFILLLVLLIWTTIAPTIPDLVRTALLMSIGAVAVIGVTQGLLPGIAPAAIDPFGEVGNPSLMGYKNPAALSVMAQIFILAGAAFAHDRPRVGLQVLLKILLVVELVYLVGLQSRSALTALVVGLLVLGVLWPLSSRGTGRRAAAALAFAGVVVLGSLAVNPPAMSKAKSIVHYLGSPRTYLDSDRGTYLVNTINMVRRLPLGVGLGDWQTMYPVYRKLKPETAFNDRFQVRRAHSDHVQILGEGGWPGLALWSAFLVILVGRTAFVAVRRRHQGAAFLTAQLAAITAAMATDFFTEIPYNKLEFFVVVFLAFSLARPVRPGTDTGTTDTLGRGPWLLVTIVAAAATTATVVGSVQTERKLIASATSTALFLKAAEPDCDPRMKTVLLEDATTIGATWTHRYGHWKSLFRDHLALARSAQLTGRAQLARDEAVKSLQLQPFNPQGLRLMVELSADPVESVLWENALRHVEQTPGNGFRILHPLGESYTDMTN